MIFLSLLGLIVVFSAVCIVCDEHLVPAVEVFIKEYQVPEEVAAVTLVAFGSAAPELMLNTVGAAEQDSSLSLPSVLGSAMIAFGLIPSAALLFSHHRALQIEVWPLLRETTFYLIGLLLFLKVIDDAVTELLEAIAMTSVYFIYVGTVVGVHLINRSREKLTVGKDIQSNDDINYDNDDNHNMARILNASGNLELQQLGCSTPLDIPQISTNTATRDLESGNSNINKTLFSPDQHEMENDIDIHDNNIHGSNGNNDNCNDDSNVPLLSDISNQDNKNILSIKTPPKAVDISVQEDLNNLWDRCTTPLRAIFIRIIPSLRPNEVSGIRGNNNSGSSISQSKRNQNDSNNNDNNNNNNTSLLDRFTSSFSPNRYDSERNQQDEALSSSSSSSAAAAAAAATITDSDFFDDESHIHDRPEKPHRWLINEVTARKETEMIVNSSSSLFDTRDKGQKISSESGSSFSNNISMDKMNDNQNVQQPSIEKDTDDKRLGKEEKVIVMREENVSLFRAISALVVSIICIGILASCIIYFCADIAMLMGIDNSTLGATLVALGAEIPDTISAISLSRSGFTHGAISGAIGSQVINISLGVGLPALLQCLSKKHMEIRLAKEDTTSLGLLVCLVFVVLASFMLVTIPLQKILCSCQLPRFSHLNRYGALMLLLVWFTSFMSFIVLN